MFLMGRGRLGRCHTERNANIRVWSLRPQTIEIAHFAPEKNLKFLEKNLKKHLHYSSTWYILKKLVKGEEAGSYRAKGEFPWSMSSPDEGAGIRLFFSCA